MKGITPVIAVILLLLITIAIIGFTSVFFQQTVTTGGEQAQQAAAGQANKALQTAEIVDVSNGKVTIKNVGTEPISTDNVGVFVDGVPADVLPYGGAGEIAPGSSKTFDVTVPFGSGERTIVVSVPGNSQSTTMQLDAGTTELISAEGNVVTLKNTGAVPIQKSDIIMKLDDDTVSFSGPDSLESGAEGTYTIDISAMPAQTGTKQLDVAIPGASSYSINVDINIGTLSFEGAAGNDVTVRNTGLTPLSTSLVSVKVAGQSVSFAPSVAEIPAGDTAVFAVNEIGILSGEGMGGALEIDSPGNTTGDAVAFDYLSSTKGYWKFDELNLAGGRAIPDHSGNGIDGSFVGTLRNVQMREYIPSSTYNAISPVVVAGKYGNGVRLDGANDALCSIVNCNTNLYLPGLQSFTLTAWINIDSDAVSGNQMSVFGSSQSTPAFGYKASDNRIWNYRQYCTGPPATPCSTSLDELRSWPVSSLYPGGLKGAGWHHIALVVDQSSFRATAYLDGTSLGTQAIGSQGYTHGNGGIIKIGASYKDYSMYFKGVIDEARIYRGKILTAAEITEDMNSQYPVQGVTDSYSFEGISGSTVYDTHFIAKGKNDAPSDPDGAVQLNGIDEYVEIGNPAALRVAGGDFSVSAYSYARESRCGMEIIEKANNIICGTDTNGGWSLGGNNGYYLFRVSDGTALQSRIVKDTALGLNQWIHSVGTRGGNGIKLYVNGAKIDNTKDVTGFTIDDTKNLRLGGSVTAWRFNGLIDEVRIMNRAVSKE